MNLNLLRSPSRPGSRLWPVALAGLVFLPGLAAYFTGEDFIFIHFAAGDNPFYWPSQDRFYRPLPNLLWELDYRLWRLEAPGYHLTNLLLHLANAWLTGRLALRLTGNPAVAWWASVLFACHPIHSEAVIWLAARPDLLATFFFLAGLLAGLKFLDSGGWLPGLAALASYAAGLLSKEAAAGLPLALAVWAWLLEPAVRRRGRFFLLGRLALYLPALAAYLVLRVAALGGLGGYAGEGRELLYSLWNATLGLWLPLLFPVNIESAGWLPGLALVAGLLAVYGRLGYRLLRARPEWSKLAAPAGVALTLMYAGMLPALASAPVGLNLAQSRLLYLPSAGFCWLLALVWVPARHIRPATASRAAPATGRAVSRWPELSLPVIYITGVVIATLPWLQAGSLVKTTFDRLPRPALPAAGAIYYEGLPDSWRGAYVWRNGLDEATRLMLNPRLEGINRTPELLVDYRKTAGGPLWFVRYDFRPGPPDLAYNFSYYVTGPAGSAGTAEPAGPDFAACRLNGWRWESVEGRLECQAPRGLLFNTLGQKTNLTFSSPPLDTNRPLNGLELELYLDYDFQQPQVAAEIILYDRDEREYFRQPFDLAADGRPHRYRLNLPETGQPQTPNRLALKMSKFRSNILWQGLRWYSGTEAT